jgi:FkbM family methyltransferase
MRVDDLVGGIVDSREFHVGNLYRRIAESADRPPRREGRAVTRVDLPGRVQFLDPDDPFVSKPIMETGSYEPHLTEAIADELTTGATFIDVGANLGWFALLAASRVGPNGFVLAVEADPSNAELLCRSSRESGFRNVVVLPIAASDAPGAMILQRTGGSNAAVFVAAGPSAPGDRLTSCVPLDALSGLLDRVDVMKVDVEGAELLVLRGAVNLIRRYRPRIFLEYSPGMLERLPGSTVKDLAILLDDVDYAIDVVAFDGSLVRVKSLPEATEYLDAQQRDHVDLKVSPR